jgi:hypothetical protein
LLAVGRDLGIGIRDFNLAIVQRALARQVFVGGEVVHFEIGTGCVSDRIVAEVFNSDKKYATVLFATHMPTLTLPDFVNKWRNSRAHGASAAAQTHFLELCDVLGAASGINRFLGRDIHV